MERQPARVLEEEDVGRLLIFAKGQRHSVRNTVIILLSFKAGLRACEISGLTWPMVLKTNGAVDDQLRISKHIAKYGSGRSIPLHTELRKALTAYHRLQGKPNFGPVVRSERGGRRLAARSVVNWFHRIYADLNLPGCSSHSGRRTFITRSARIVSKTGGSLRDVQELAGHRALTTTERYIQGNRDAQRLMVSMI
jgi:integrase/recombinase XerC